MIFLFEQITYSLDYLKKVLPTDSTGRFKGLPNSFVTRDNKLDGVGYLYNGCPTKTDGQKADASDKVVFVLPKVFLEGAEDKDERENVKAFGQKVPEGDDFLSKDVPTDFLSNLSMWVCSSIAQYRQENPQDKEMKAPDARNFVTDKVPTLIDVMNAMKLFYAENKNLFVFTAKNKYSGNNHIDWRRTVTHTQPFMLGDTPIYMNLENKKKVFDLDDRLLVLYFSAMNYIEENFPAFMMPRSEFYSPMRGNEFRRLLGHRGLMELRRIKHKYFADKFLKLYNIMKAFFEWGGSFSANGFESEYLLTSKYNNVFETMIDKLVGDGGKSIESLKHNDDGKIIDHLYKEPSLVFAGGDTEKIWHIGDSKYYQDPDDIKGESIAKQFTYAKNVIQDFFSPNYVNQEIGDDEKDKRLHEKDIHSGVRYRDPLTEGYSVTPNFFIRGSIPEFNKAKANIQFNDPYFRESPNAKIPIKVVKKLSDKLWKNRNRHFKNRLFDRDTLLLQVYNVNFLYVLKAYTSKRSNLRDEFKKTARDMFRKNFLELLDEKYVFYAIWPKNSEIDFVDSHFRILAGKIFKPAGLGCLILALEKDSPKDEQDSQEKMWGKIEDECKMIARVSPREIWDDGEKKLEEAEFSKVFFDKKLNGFFIEKSEFDKAEIGKTHKLPKYLREKPVDGSIYVEMGHPSTSSDSPKRDEYYFLPCK